MALKKVTYDHFSHLRPLPHPHGPLIKIQRHTNVRTVPPYWPSVRPRRPGFASRPRGHKLTTIRAKSYEWCQDIDDFIKVNRTSKWEEKGHDLDSLIEVKDNNSKEGNKDLDDFIVVNCTFEPSDRRSQELNNLIQVNHMSNQLRKDGYQEVEDLIEVNRISNRIGRSGPQDVEDLIEVNRLSNQKGRFSDLDSFIEVKDRKNQRAKELCTYCRKPLGTDTKMILETLQICCHARCFKCEICKASLENLEAGDSIWIYKDRVHCSPCYSKVKAAWIY
ncbi:sciellin [Erythrolamprus reginae]|uniref:sciellin n=1 Tax=Erythrolamprus reginae TaxID=121349 RepID=UPI00396CE515